MDLCGSAIAGSNRKLDRLVVAGASERAPVPGDERHDQLGQPLRRRAGGGERVAHALGVLDGRAPALLAVDEEDPRAFSLSEL